jgi:phytoene dehydrogenase-like protein
VIARQVLSPMDIKRRFGFTGATSSRALFLNQLFFLRPVIGWTQYRTPITGLFLCAVVAQPGWNAARPILRKS